MKGWTQARDFPAPQKLHSWLNIGQAKGGVSVAKDDVIANIRRSLNRKGPLATGVAPALERRFGTAPEQIQPSYDEPLVERLSERRLRLPACGGCRPLKCDPYGRE